ncbi:hypothetical protein MNBD_ALPHA12-354 [hydrothermal vent metagenome]|uniref:DUF2007 domain-containing protein n=1 Tax=hydrothermal vent metagenome TaxID=652676 RepID=A0A3B0T868_9ZZZZ
MANFETILTHRDVSILRIIVVALKAHGFHPEEDDVSWLPGITGMISPDGASIKVPSGEAEDAKLLAKDLLKEMLR